MCSLRSDGVEVVQDDGRLNPKLNPKLNPLRSDGVEVASEQDDLCLWEAKLQVCDIYLYIYVCIYICIYINK